MRNALLLAPNQLKAWRRRQRGRKIVFTAGSFDLLHIGHLRYLARAKSCGEVLVVGVPSNESLRQLKGSGRPLVDEKARALALTYLTPVDFVVVFPQRTVATVLRRLRPDVFFTVDEGWNRGLRESEEYRLVKSCGGEVVVSPRQSPFISASAIINKVAGIKVREIFRECLAATEETSSFTEDWERLQLRLEI